MKNRKKKNLFTCTGVLLLVCVIALSFGACKPKQDPTPDEDDRQEEEPQEPETPEYSLNHINAISELGTQQEVEFQDGKSRKVFLFGERDKRMYGEVSVEGATMWMNGENLGKTHIFSFMQGDERWEVEFRPDSPDTQKAQAVVFPAKLDQLEVPAGVTALFRIWVDTPVGLYNIKIPELFELMDRLRVDRSSGSQYDFGCDREKNTKAAFLEPDKIYWLTVKNDSDAPATFSGFVEPYPIDQLPELQIGGTIEQKPDMYNLYKLTASEAASYFLQFDGGGIQPAIPGGASYYCLDGTPCNGSIFFETGSASGWWEGTVKLTPGQTVLFAVSQLTYPPGGPYDEEVHTVKIVDIKTHPYSYRWCVNGEFVPITQPIDVVVGERFQLALYRDDQKLDHRYGLEFSVRRDVSGGGLMWEMTYSNEDCDWVSVFVYDVWRGLEDEANTFIPKYVYDVWRGPEDGTIILFPKSVEVYVFFNEEYYGHTESEIWGGRGHPHIRLKLRLTYPFDPKSMYQD